MGDLTTDLLCFGNPLLDMILRVEDGQLLTKYRLLPDNQIEADDDQKALFDEVFARSGEVTFCPGGCAQNTARIYRWILGDRSSVSFVGAVGADKFGQRLEKLVRADGVNTRYVVHEDRPTGRAVSLVWGTNRSLVADLGAATLCRPDRVFSPHNLALLTGAQFVYIEGFFVTHDPETAVQVARYCSHSGRRLVFSLSGTYVCERHTSTICQLLPHVSFLFGHVTELTALARALGLEDEFDISPLGYARLLDAASTRLNTVEAMTQSDEPDQPADQALLNGDSPQLRIIVTQSADPVLLLDDVSVVSVPVPAIDERQIVDTTGAGDAVVGGFLAGQFLGESLEDSVRYGVLAAREVVQALGCSIPARRHPLTEPPLTNGVAS
ncbi:Adenosine kinase [Amphibalanus amphitrite]|uniref:Adenosine kinase n=1 Tax=Amphibalanus amphitrite TaxID=1232801 RepID=A0A6A4VQ11_AMPAM|nr:adenosine kinase-like isoform X2 [Amphibalanus amphitrite]KAF0296304.1 Adenosine kinase [Amphibalanus amphitrite]KAF0296305.1 Adenosine kinase [Amphibalanus amphitrite]KAF0296306.1 Adenosine kinase [Amphibalanus amphitrite]